MFSLNAFECCYFQYFAEIYLIKKCNPLLFEFSLKGNVHFVMV